MKQTVLGILTAATLAFTLPAAGEDIAGWHEAKWGMTTDEVQSALGKPEKIFNLGAKQIYVYKDVKVTFQNGKVADVQ